MEMKLFFFPAISEKLRSKHRVSEREVEEAFMNRTGKLLMEVRTKNQGENPRYWFIAETDRGRRLKVVFAVDPEESGPVIITAYDSNPTEEKLYAKLQ